MPNRKGQLTRLMLAQTQMPEAVSPSDRDVPTPPFLLSSSSHPRRSFLPSSSPSRPMPARTLPTPTEPALSPPRFLPRPQPHSHRRRDSYTPDDTLPRPQPSYALVMPAQLIRIDTTLNAPPAAVVQATTPADQQGWPPAATRVYPDPASIPPHWQAHPVYRDARPPGHFVPPGTSLQTNSQFAWARAYALNPYARAHPAQPFVAPPPPPVPHKVWILDCKSCGMFLTNRGMKVSLPGFESARDAPSM